MTQRARMEFPGPSCVAATKSKYVLSLCDGQRPRFLGNGTGKCILVTHTLYMVISETSMCSLRNIRVPLK